MYKYRGQLTALLGFLLLFLPPVPFRPILCIGFLIFFAAFFLRVWARMHIGEHTRGSELACPGFAKTGPYKFFSHPLYVSNFIAGISFAFLHAGFSFWALGFCAVYGMFLAMLAINENKFLRTAIAAAGVKQTLRGPLCTVLRNDRYTWIWQIALLALIFLRKMKF